jgi:hypothetical protein
MRPPRNADIRVTEIGEVANDRVEYQVQIGDLRFIARISL